MNMNDFKEMTPIDTIDKVIEESMANDETIDSYRKYMEDGKFILTARSRIVCVSNGFESFDRLVTRDEDFFEVLKDYIKQNMLMMFEGSIEGFHIYTTFEEYIIGVPLEKLIFEYTFEEISNILHFSNVHCRESETRYYEEKHNIYNIFDDIEESGWVLELLMDEAIGEGLWEGECF